MTETPKDWHETMKLRFVGKGMGLVDMKTVLQQAWRNVSTNELEWRDVSVTEEN